LPTLKYWPPYEQHGAVKPVVPKVWVATQAKVTKGQKMGRAEAIQTWAIYF